MKNRLSRWKRAVFGIALLLGVGSVDAAPAHCSYGYQDSSCITPQYRAPQTPPAGCSTAAGWTTVTAAKWMGSGYTQPVCSYQAPPSCPSGFNQVGPDWNGSAWVNLQCTPAAPPVVPADQCESLVDHNTYHNQYGYAWTQESKSVSYDATQNGIPSSAVTYEAIRDSTNNVDVAWTGPTYTSEALCVTSNVWHAWCYVNGSTGAAYGVLWTAGASLSCGGNH